jgi:2-oxoglutarate dehydrogenase E1 component
LDYRVTSTLAEDTHTIKDVEEYLNKLYCSSVGVEFEHIQNEDERLWLYENYESTMKEQFTPAEKVKMVQLLVRTEEMEKLQ